MGNRSEEAQTSRGPQRGRTTSQSPGQAINSVVRQDADGQLAGAWESMVTTDQCTELANQARGKSSALVAVVPQLRMGYTEMTESQGADLGS